MYARFPGLGKENIPFLMPQLFSEKNMETNQVRFCYRTIAHKGAKHETRRAQWNQ